MSSTLTQHSMEVDRLARAYMRDRNVDYRTAVHAIVHQASVGHEQQVQRATAKYAQQHGGLPDDWRIYEDSTGTILEVELKNAGRALTQLSNIVAALPRLDSGEVDAALALRVIRNEFPDLGRDSAGGFLHHRAKKLMGESHPAENLDLPAAMRQAGAEFPDVNAVYNGSPMSESALRVILLPMLRR